MSLAMADAIIRPARSGDAIAIADAHVDARRVAMPWLPKLHSRDDTIRYFTLRLRLSGRVAAPKAEPKSAPDNGATLDVQSTIPVFLVL